MTNIVDSKTLEKDSLRKRDIGKIVDRLTIGDLSPKAFIKVSFGFENFILYGHAGTLISSSGLFQDLSDAIVANVEDKSWNLRIASNMYLSQYHDILLKLWKDMHTGGNLFFYGYNRYNLNDLLKHWDIIKLLKLFEGSSAEILIDQFSDGILSILEGSSDEEIFLARNHLRKIIGELRLETSRHFTQELRLIERVENLVQGQRFVEGELLPLATYQLEQQAREDALLRGTSLNKDVIRLTNEFF